MIKYLGYDPNLEKFTQNKKNINEIQKIKIDTFVYEVPNYLINKELPDNPSSFIIKKSLYFTRNIIQNRFFLPNNLIFPQSRILLENYFN